MLSRFMNTIMIATFYDYTYFVFQVANVFQLANALQWFGIIANIKFQGRRKVLGIGQAKY